MIEVADLNKSFGRLWALKHVSLRCDRHVYGLLGPNGSGKTTLIRCITLLYPEGQRAIRWDGQPVRKPSDYLSKIGYLPQRFGLYKELSVREALQMFANLKGIAKQNAKAEIERCVESVNLTERIDSRVGTLSGGMLRRVGIAQALIGDPELLIFDEPTAGLDPEERLRFKNLVTDIRRNKTVLISTHIVEDVEASCDRIIILHEGQVSVQDSNDAVRRLAEGKVYDFPEEQIADIQGNYSLIKKYEHQGQVRLRMISADPQILPVALPEIEDGYLCVIRGV